MFIVRQSHITTSSSSAGADAVGCPPSLASSFGQTIQTVSLLFKVGFCRMVKLCRRQNSLRQHTPRFELHGLGHQPVACWPAARTPASSAGAAAVAVATAAAAAAAVGFQCLGRMDYSLGLKVQDLGTRVQGQGCCCCCSCNCCCCVSGFGVQGLWL